MDYRKFYELDREPFQNDQDEHFYFESGVHKRARMRLLRGVQQRKALSVLIGGPGCGKTTLAGHIFAGLSGDEFAARLLPISHADCAHGWLLPHVARAFGVAKPAARGPDQLDQIFAALVSHIRKGSHPVLLVDEAQLLSNVEVMEEFRGLLNLVHDGKMALSLLLFGLPELNELLRLDAPLAQRVEIRTEVVGLSLEEVSAYVRHRLECAGAGEAIFSDDALDALYAYTGGIPRLVNTLADNALFEGLLSEAKPVDGSLVAAAAEQLELAPPGASPAASSQDPVPDLAAFDADDSLVLGDPVRADQGVELHPESEEAAGGDSLSDFSMGSMVVDVAEPDGVVDADPVLGDSHDEERVAGGASGSAAVSPTGEEEIELDEDPDADLAVMVSGPDTETDLSEVPEVGAAVELETADDDDEEIELELEVADAEPDIEPQVGNERGGDTEIALEIEPEPEPEPRVEAKSNDDTFDPGELLFMDDDEEESAPSLPAAEPAAKSAAKPAAVEQAEDGEDLDDLFESLQVGN